MLRQIHSLPGLILALVVMVLAMSGAILSLEPALERAAAPAIEPGRISVAALAEAAKARHGEIDKIVRTASGSIIVSYFDGDRAGAERVDPATGAALGAHAPSGFMRWITNLHRAFLAGDAGRAVAGFGALAMLMLSISGAMMLAARLGGWRAFFRPVRGTPVQRWHTVTGRIVLPALLLSALTGCYLSLATFELIPDASINPPALTAPANGGPRVPVGDLAALKAVDLADLRELAFPYASDLTDTYALTTARGVNAIDAATGAELGFAPHGLARQVHEFFYMLHTGQGLWPLALLLGLAALGVPVLAIAGAIIWWQRRRALPRLRDNVAAEAADTIILVGSEGNTTWGFARTLHAALTAAGHRVHAAPMNALAPRYARAMRMLILTATYGEGAPPASASAFLARLEKSAAPLPVAVLGFGDRNFPRFCQFAEDVAAALAARGWPRLIDLHRIDRQSAQDFALWGDRLGAALGHALPLAHVAAPPATVPLALLDRIDYGAQVQAPTTILSFSTRSARGGIWQRLFSRRIPAFEAGDLVGIVPPGSSVPRFYSLASSRRDGVLEICVRKQPGGLCSGFLHELTPGGTIEAFIRPNPDFRPNRSKAPLILIGAGAGIGPLVGFIRHLKAARPVHLYWGGRDPASDFLYRDELEAHLAERRLTRLSATFSRLPGGGYVQDRLAADAAALRALIEGGAQIMVCGGRDMAAGVAAALDTILKPMGRDLADLKSGGLYVEDVY